MLHFYSAMKAFLSFLFLFVKLSTYALPAKDTVSPIADTDTAITKPSADHTLQTIALATGYAGFTFVTYRFFDDDIQHFAQANQNHVLSSFARTIEYAGLGSSSIIITTATAVTSIITKDKQLQKTAILLAGGHVINDLITNEIKITFQRHRPNTGDADHTFDWRGGPKKNTSFISSHTSNAFATATAFATVYKNSDWVPPVAYSAAALIGLCRIYNNAHWASDVLGGAAIGFASVKAVNGLYTIAAKKISFLPQVNNGHYSAIMICFLGK